MSINEKALDTLKSFLDLCFISASIVIVYENYPSVSIEYTGEDFKISITHLNYTPFFVKTQEKVHYFISKFSNGYRKISRIHVNNKNITSVIYGELYNHELKYVDENKIVKWDNVGDTCK
jgi:hypothetical protein